MKKSITRISFGLFLGSFWMKLKDVPIFLKRVVYTLRHGYPPQATWEIYEWHRCVMLETLSEFRKNLNGYPASYDDEDSSPEEQYAKWGAIIDEMCNYLDAMSEDSYDYSIENFKKNDLARTEAKDKFFALFSKYYFLLWD